MNASLGNVGKTVFYTDPDRSQSRRSARRRCNDLVKDLDAGAVDLLLILGGNPVFNAPVELGMRDRIQKARMRVHLSLYEDETSAVVPVAPARSALSGNLGRCAGLRRHGVHPAAADRSRSTVAGRHTNCCRRSPDAPDMRPLRNRQGLLGGAAHGRGFRNLVAARGARRRGRPVRRCPRRPRRCMATALAAAARRSGSWAATSKSFSGPIRPSTTAASPTTAGCRNCPSRSPS